MNFDKDEIKQTFTLTDAMYPKVVNFVSVLASKQFQSGTCKEGMVEFLKNSSFYEMKNHTIFINGFIFKQGDLRVKIGVLIV